MRTDTCTCPPSWDYQELYGRSRRYLRACKRSVLHDKTEGVKTRLTILSSVGDKAKCSEAFSNATRTLHEASML